MMAENDRTVRWYLGQMWRDLLSVYYANTPVWRLMKSGALLFLGFFAWMGGSVLLSVEPGWTFLHYVMAYGFLLLAWGPLTHFVVVPLTIRLRRTGEHPLSRLFARNSGKINLAVFFTLVVVVGTLTPGVMMLEFGAVGGGSGVDVSGDLVCDVGGETVSCRVENAEGIDHVVVTSGGEPLRTVEEEPFAFGVDRDELAETRSGKEFVVEYRDEDGDRLRRLVRTVP